ncbi:hypothetical protein FC36_GL000496 [Ligilactobacillus equi DSM 15833 = JCM 10991]|uniref:Uncharacterized protein n=1 Tax=Ligilactobacillus equi DSM 15833 = JCM 10991 TaxID=1423740 RepID=A0A0R1THG6_9LACO|nr:hypothetical protein FC36_GL000496 [Ligilactobacillus equi DSM 15833 = JCM 10991]
MCYIFLHIFKKIYFFKAIHLLTKALKLKEGSRYLKKDEESFKLGKKYRLIKLNKFA